MPENIKSADGSGEPKKRGEGEGAEGDELASVLAAADDSALERAEGDGKL